MNNINFKSLGKAILLLLLYLVIIPTLVQLFCNLFKFNLDTLSVTLWANLAIYIISLIVLIVIYHKSLIEDWHKFFHNFKRNFKIGMMYWLKALVFMMVTNLIIVSLAGGIATNEEANRSIISIAPLFSILSMCLIGPFLEEMIFRKGFKDAFKTNQVFLIVSALLFGGAHLMSAFTLGTITENLFQLLYLIPYGGIGYFFAKAYLETDTIFTSTMMHIVHNTMSVTLVLLMGLGV